jgi:hypothetical protein
MTAQRQVPAGPFVNETATAQYQIPGGPFINETVAAAGGALPTLSLPRAKTGSITATGFVPQWTAS